MLERGIRIWARHYAQLRYISSHCEPVFCDDQRDRNAALTMTEMMPRANPLPPSLPPSPLAPRRNRRAIDSALRSISDNSRCAHVRRIYIARKAELCLSNINTILASEITMLRALRSRTKTTMYLREQIRTSRMIYPDRRCYAFCFCLMSLGHPLLD